MNKRRIGRSFRLALLGCVAIMAGDQAMTPAYAAAVNDAPVPGGTLRIASLDSDLDAFDPLTGYSIESWEVLRAVTRQLVTYPGSPTDLRDDTKLVPDLAESWDVSPDGKTYTFHLRDGVNYSGASTRKIVAKDFVYGIKRFLRPEQTGRGNRLFQPGLLRLRRILQGIRQSSDRQSGGHPGLCRRA